MRVGWLVTIYTLDQNGNQDVDANGNPIPPTADTGAVSSWTGEWYVDPLGSISELSFHPLSLVASFWPIKGANASTNAAAVIEETLYVRNFAPWPAFGPDPLAGCLFDCFLGDNRGFTTSLAQSVTSRVNGIVQIIMPGVIPITARAYSNQSTAIFRRPPLNTATAKPTITKTFDGTTLTLHMAGANPLVPLSPDIDTHLTLTGSSTPGQVCYSGHLSGDTFPNTEVFIINSTGQATMLVDFATPFDRNTGPLKLIGDNNLDEGSFTNVCAPK